MPNLTTTAFITMIILLSLNGACLIGLDRAPSRSIALGPDDGECGYPVIDPPTGRRALWRPLCLLWCRGHSDGGGDRAYLHVLTPGWGMPCPGTTSLPGSRCTLELYGSPRFSWAVDLVRRSDGHRRDDLEVMEMKPQLRTSSQSHGERDVSVCNNCRVYLAVLSVGRDSAAVGHFEAHGAAGDVDLSAVAGLFSRRTFRALAASQPGQLRGIAQCLGRTDSSGKSTTLADAFDDALRLMTKRYRNEYVFKNTIVDRIVFGRHSPRTAAALLELRAGKSIVDVAVFNGTSTAYEIKTDLDDFSRLGQQLSCYEESFERVAVVTSPRLAPRVLAAVPKYVGVLALTDRGSLSEMRAPTSGLERLSQVGLFGLLRRQETLNILERTLGYEIDVPPASLWRRTRDLFLSLAIDAAHAHVVDELRTRGMRAATNATAMPRSLRAMAYEVPLNASEARRVRAKLVAPAASFAV